MKHSRTIIALLGLTVSVILTIGIWVFLDAAILLLFLPFIPLLGWRYRERGQQKSCSVCGFETREPDVLYCPRDGTRLETE